LHLFSHGRFMLFALFTFYRLFTRPSLSFSSAACPNTSMPRRATYPAFPLRTPAAVPALRAAFSCACAAGLLLVLRLRVFFLISGFSVVTCRNRRHVSLARSSCGAAFPMNVSRDEPLPCSKPISPPHLSWRHAIWRTVPWAGRRDWRPLFRRFRDLRTAWRASGRTALFVRAAPRIQRGIRRNIRLSRHCACAGLHWRRCCWRRWRFLHCAVPLLEAFFFFFFFFFLRKGVVPSTAER